MRPLGRSARGAIFAGIVAWHALVVLLLLRQRIVLPESPELVTTWLRLDADPRRSPRLDRPPAAVHPPLLAPSSLSAAEAPEITPVPSPDTAISVPSEVDWYGEAARAAREQYSGRLPTPRSLEDKPKVMEMPAPERRAHRRGDQEPIINGKSRLWVNDHCWTMIDAEAPPPPGQLRPMVIQCQPKPPPIDAAVLERRKPQYLLEPPLKLPSRKGSGPGQTRPGPAMGGTPGP